MNKKAEILVSGTVQGVGFRPFVSRLANDLGLSGHVKNLGDAGVEIALYAGNDQVTEFVRRLKSESPVNSRIEDVSIRYIDANDTPCDFRIIESGGRGIGGLIPADTGICERCATELFDPSDRRFGYPLISCTDCGPRYSLLESLPLDRDSTSYRVFMPCPDCIKEYSLIDDRRFHAQNIACPACGPRYFLLDGDGKRIAGGVEAAIEKICRGAILAIKNASGIHLACLAGRDDVILKLRDMCNRERKPFAVMAPLGIAKKFACMSESEEALIKSRERPIVVLRLKEPGCNELIAPSVTCGLDSVGVMLPYTGLHELIYQKIKEPLVMTSANLYGNPMITGNEGVRKEELADLYLMHDLNIVNRCDDSVIKIAGGRETFIRRSRGFAPLPVYLKNPEGKNILALGAQENVSFCLLRGNRAFLSQHIGNAGNLATLDYLETMIGRFLAWIPGRIDAIACDLHPGFNTTRLASRLSEELHAPIHRVQHHHAHLMSLSAEHSVSELVGICCDGVGYGLDGTSWGGEVFVYKNDGIERAGHLKEQRMPGGDLCAEYPARMVAGILHGSFERDELKPILSKLYFRHGPKEIDLVLDQLVKGINVSLTSSTGRVLDAVAALLGVSRYRSYEGEPAMRLEAAGRGGKDLCYPLEINNDVLDTSSLLAHVAVDRDSHDVKDIAYSAHSYLARGLSAIAIRHAKKEGIGAIGLSGGVAYNDIIASLVAELVGAEGLEYVSNCKVPCGDGGISYGQAAYVVSDARLE